MVTYAISDLHGQLPSVPGDAELLLIAGDICPDFRPYGRHNHWDIVDKSGTQQADWLHTDFRRWLEALEDRGVSVVATWGNHDFVGEHPSLVPELPWTLLVDESAYVGDLHIYGTPWVPGLAYWAFFGDDRRLQFRADAIPKCDILMTHGPPKGMGDYIPTSEKQRTKYGNYGGEHVGDPTLNDAIMRVQPDVVLCGHIHEARGDFILPLPSLPVWRDSIDPMPAIAPERRARVINVAAVDEVYRMRPRPFWRVY